MKKPTAIKAAFVDVVEVLLTNRREHPSRRAATTLFHLDWEAMEGQDWMKFDPFEETQQ